MAKSRVRQVYQRVFFDRLMLVGIIFLTLSYIMRESWGGAFAQAAAIVVGIVWSYRAVTTHPSVVFRLLAALVLLLISSLLALYLGEVHNQL